MKHFLPVLILGLLMTSCQVYRTQFDCSPGVGLPCTSVTDIEKMIIETPDESPDIFLSYLPSPKPICVKVGTPHALERKVWIPKKIYCCGRVVEGHYIYLSKGKTDSCKSIDICPRRAP